MDYLSESTYRLVIWSALAGEHDTALAETVTRPVAGLGGEYVQNGLQTAGRGDGGWGHGDELACRPRFTPYVQQPYLWVKTSGEGKKAPSLRFT